MATFDTKLFNKIIYNMDMAQDGLTVQLAFGMPLSLFALTPAHLEVIPSVELSNILSIVQGAKAKAGSVLKSVSKKIMMDSGVIEYAADDGKSILYHKSSKNAFWFNESDIINNLFAVQNSLGDIDNLVVNKNINPGQVSQLGTILGQLIAMKSFTSGQAAETRENFSQSLAAGTGGPATFSFQDYVKKEYASEMTKATAANDFIAKCKGLISGIKKALQERTDNPEKAPVYNSDSSYDHIFGFSTISRSESTDPKISIEPDTPIFDLVYGPPKSVQGQFLLSQDGLYYDSQKGGLDPVFIHLDKKEKSIAPGDKWKFEHDPNIGGKGTSISYSALQALKADLFNLDIVDDSETMQEYYDKDHFLQVIVGQKNKHVYDSSAYLAELESSEGEDSAMVINLRQSLYSDISRHDYKINRRKKQIEIGIKAPRTFTSKTLSIINFDEDGVPINDFSYLKDLNINVALGVQEKLVFNQSEVSGVILPLNPKFVVAPDYIKDDFLPEDLLIPEVGKGSIGYSSSSVSGTDARVTSLVDQITTDSLIGIYNFLEPQVLDPDSEVYQVVNCSNDKLYNNAQLVGNSTSGVFVSGLAIPYLKGIVETDETASTVPSSLGSYVKLQNTAEFRNLGYRREGFSFESWVHVPNLDSSTAGWMGGGASSLTKVLLGCENIGDPAGTDIGAPDDFDKVSPDLGDSVVRGLVLGFSRDRRLANDGVNSSNAGGDNSPDNTVFFIAPTQSINDSSACTFINKEIYNNNSCPSSYSFHKMIVSGTTLGTHSKSYGDVSSSFMLVNVSVDPNKDEIRMSLDGELMATSSLAEVFATRKYSPVNIPSLVRSNSFEYNSSSVIGVKKLQGGPKLHKAGTINPIGFTPWIIGGGYTDGMYKDGNFMGGTTGGVTSGLRGFIGSTKFYNKALVSTEVKKNYDSQKGFFKNIKI